MCIVVSVRIVHPSRTIGLGAKPSLLVKYLAMIEIVHPTRRGGGFQRASVQGKLCRLSLTRPVPAEWICRHRIKVIRGDPAHNPTSEGGMQTTTTQRSTCRPCSLRMCGRAVLSATIIVQVSFGKDSCELRYCTAYSDG